MLQRFCCFIYFEVKVLCIGWFLGNKQKSFLQFAELHSFWGENIQVIMFLFLQICVFFISDDNVCGKPYPSPHCDISLVSLDPLLFSWRKFQFQTSPKYRKYALVQWGHLINLASAISDLYFWQQLSQLAFKMSVLLVTKASHHWLLLCQRLKNETLGISCSKVGKLTKNGDGLEKWWHVMDIYKLKVIFMDVTVSFFSLSIADPVEDQILVLDADLSTFIWLKSAS